MNIIFNHFSNFTIILLLIFNGFQVANGSLDDNDISQSLGKHKNTLLSTIFFDQHHEVYYLEPEELFTNNENLKNEHVVINLSGDQKWSQKLSQLSNHSSQIVGFDLSENFLTGEDLKKLASFPKIKWLSLENSYINNDKIKILPKFLFSSLNISYNEITSESIHFISGQKLINFNCSATYINDIGAKYIQQNMPILQVLNIQNCNITKNGLSFLKGIKTLLY